MYRADRHNREAELAAFQWQQRERHSETQKWSLNLVGEALMYHLPGYLPTATMILRGYSAGFGIIFGASSFPIIEQSGIDCHTKSTSRRNQSNETKNPDYVVCWAVNGWILCDAFCSHQSDHERPTCPTARSFRLLSGDRRLLILERHALLQVFWRLFIYIAPPVASNGPIWWRVAVFWHSRLQGLCFRIEICQTSAALYRHSRIPHRTHAICRHDSAAVTPKRKLRSAVASK